MTSNDNSTPPKPVEDTGPEWDSVEQERDYWKKLALSQGAKLGAISEAMRREWTTEIAPDGRVVVKEDDSQQN